MVGERAVGVQVLRACREGRLGVRRGLGWAEAAAELRGAAVLCPAALSRPPQPPITPLS